MTSARDFPYQTVTGKKFHWEASSWCEKQFGPRWEAVGHRTGVWCTFWKGRGFPGDYEWFFQNEKDFLLFQLKWPE